MEFIKSEIVNETLLNIAIRVAEKRKIQQSIIEKDLHSEIDLTVTDKKNKANKSKTDVA